MSGFQSTSATCLLKLNVPSCEAGRESHGSPVLEKPCLYLSFQQSENMIGYKVFFALSVFTGIFAQPQPKAPGLTYLYTANITLGETIDYGDGPHGHRSFSIDVGGTFSGPILKGVFHRPQTKSSRGLS
tara:strand:- start:272 stop:658 length:387 start_codon:yes stop_codon:yes gene_type:complete